MPKGQDNSGAQVYPIKLSDEFIEGLARVWSPRVLDHIQSLVSLLPTNPELGTTDVRKSLLRQYGVGLRKLCVSMFVIVYRFNEEVVEVLALEYGPNIA